MALATNDSYCQDPVLVITRLVLTTSSLDIPFPLSSPIPFQLGWFKARATKWGDDPQGGEDPPWGLPGYIMGSKYAKQFAQLLEISHF